jgi:hypothetical protein
MIRLTNRSRRRELRLPLTVAGEDLRGRRFTDETKTLNVSGGGLAFESHRTVGIGAPLLLAVQIPRPLRRYFAGQGVYRLRALVCRVEPQRDGAPRRVGVRFLGEA